MWNACEALSVDEKSINNVFFTKGLFKISSEEKVLVEPNVHGLLQNQQIVIAIDKTLILFENENQVECNFINFTSNIDCMIVSESGNIVICALSDGNIHGIYIKGRALFDIMIQSEDVCPDRTFVGIQYLDNSYYVLCTSGIVYKIHNIDESKIATLEEHPDENMDETILKNIGLDRVYSRKYETNLDRFALIPCAHMTDGYIFLAANKHKVYFLNEMRDNRIDIPETIGEIKKILYIDMKIICLGTSGALFEICPYTKLVFPLTSSENDIYIEDFVYLENDANEIELLILNKMNEQYFIRIVEFPVMKCTFELLDIGKSWLIQPNRSLNMYYLTGKDNDTDVTQEIEMKLISEVQPLQRFHKLIKMGKLELAEEFAKQFNISVQPILKEKARRIVEEIGQSEIPQNKLEVKIQQLMDLVNQIEDKHFLVSLQRADIPDRNMMGMLLEFLLKNLDKTEFKDDIDDINERIIRLGTLRIIDPYDCDLMWQDFIFNPNIIAVFKDMIKTDILNSAIVCTRHSATILPVITKQNINSILTAIPSSTPPFHIITWLKHFAPSVLNLKPYLMSYLVDWCLGETQNLETSDMWPEIGFEFINDVNSVFQGFIESYFDILAQAAPNMEKLKFLIEVLKDLATLKTNYQLNLSLREYTTDTIENITFNLLKKVQLSNFESLVDNFVFPQFNSKGLSPLPVIVRYVQFLAANRKNIPSWQIRAVTSLNLIRNEENKLECVLLVLKLASVPFSGTIKSLLKYGSTNHPLSIDILAQFKLEKIKLIKVKYGWPADSTDDSMKLIYRIIKLNLPELIDDVKSVVTLVPDIQTKAHFCCVAELARLGDIEKAVQFVDSLEPSSKSECLEMVLNSFLDEIEMNHIDPSENVIEFLKLITYRMADRDRARLRVNSIENLIALRKILNVGSITLESMIHVQDKIGMLKLGLENVIEHIKLDKEIENYFEFLSKKIILLTSLLALDPMIVYLEVAKFLDNIYISANLGMVVMELCTIDQFNLNYALEFILFVLAQQIKFSDESGNVDAEDPLIYHILKNILTHLLSLSDNLMHYSDIGDILQWISIGAQGYTPETVERQIKTIQNLVNVEIRSMYSPDNSPVSSSKQTTKKNRRESISIFEHVNTVNTLVPLVNINMESVNKCVGMALMVLVYILESDTFMSSSLRRLLHTEEINEDDISLKFFNSFEALMKIKEHKIVFVIVRNLLKACKASKKNILPDGFLNMIYKRMIKYALMQKEMPKSDINYLINIIRTSKNPQHFLEILETDLKTDVQKLNYWILCEIYYELIGDNRLLNASRDKRKKHYYCMELCKKNVTTQVTSFTNSSILNLNFISIGHLMIELTNKIVDVSLLKQLSNDFNWDIDQVLITQIITILCAQEIDYEITYDIFGKEELLVKTKFEEIVDLCRPYIIEMTNVDFLATRLIKYLSEINFYFYEMYLCILSILKLINRITPEMLIWKNILYFLKYEMVVKRKTPPGQIETDLWLKSKSEIGVLPKIAKYRFPFKPIVEEPLKTILDNEVTIANCVNWFPLVKFHSMLPNKSGTPNDIAQLQDYFCMAAVKNSISDYKSACQDSDTWQLKPTNNAFLQSVLQLVKHMTNIDKILLILYFVSNEAPNGADYVEAASECYKFSLRHESEFAENPKTKDILMKIKRKYPISKTQHLLYLYGLGEEKLFQYLETPKELIIALYNHEAILNPYKPDINNIVQEISKYNNIDYQNIQFNLLQKWLSFSLTDSCDIDLEETFYEDLNTTVNTEDLNSEYVSRAYFILSSWEIDRAKQFLISNILAENRSKSNTQNQLYLIECLSKFTDEDPSNFSIVSHKDYVSIKCIHLLKQIGFNYTKQKFNECDKLKLLKQIWVNHNTDWKGLKVLSYICLGYDVCIPTIWNGVLKQMVVLNMVSELTFLIKILSTKPALLHIDGLIMAWELVIKSIFKSANKTRTVEQETKLGKALVLLQSCPVSAKLNIKSIAEKCIQIKRPHMAAVLISLADNDDRSAIVKLIKFHSPDTLKQDIMDLEELGVIPTIINYAINIFDKM